MPRVRADILLVERGLVASREQARRAILAGEVRSGSGPVTKPGQLLDRDTVLTMASRPRFVSRGGEKLAGAFAAFGIEVRGARAVDVGASTGGFTDCLLQHGATSVVAIDVGYGQLAWRLRTDPRVAVRERTNVRDVDPSAIGAPFDLVVCDVSFISLVTVLPTLAELMGPHGTLLALVKPQFEAGKGRVGKRGVVRDPRVHEEVLAGVVNAVERAGLVVRGLTHSPLTGPEGNIEFWLWATRSGPRADVDVPAVVARAHMTFGG